ncbi:MAG: aminotransferase class I/II-fold pyridoxal phosphate-dependent enzyme [Chloroflexi bacterium]|nr:MAG: aminotransferase class I/II-fold pyridoxal phosphate-dependent enzyme [Chloroflexota bacterium]
MSDEVASHLSEVIHSMGGFLAAIMDPEIARHAADPAASNFIAGNPQELASPEYVRALQRWAEPKDKDWFGYKMPHRPALVAAAEGLSEELGLTFDADDILLARGAHGGLAAALNVVVDPGDEVIFISPPWFFYEALILGARGRPVKIRVKARDFDLDVDAIAAAISPRTRAVLINTPHNPTGRIFSEETLGALASALEDASARNGRPIYLISDEAYSRILFDGNRMITPGASYARSLLIHTYSKTTLAPGQRLGYVALAPGMPGRDQVRQAFMVAGFSTGNMLPDAIMQYALPEIDAMSIDLHHLQRKRDRVVDALREMGYEVQSPQATFYLLPKAPIEDDMLFARTLAAQKVLVLPGTAVDMPGYFRISLTATDVMIDRALPVFAEVISNLAAGVPR